MDSVVRSAARLSDGDVHLWTVELDQAAGTCEHLEALLSDDETARAARFAFDKDRRHYVVCRGALRMALGGYLQKDPAALSFTYGLHGKPALRDHGLQFSVSHSSGLGLFAFCRTVAVGVDLESIARAVDVESLATRFFAPDEVGDILTVPESDRTLAFFNGWTRKEAFIKATGAGLSHPLDSFAVTVCPGDLPRFLWMTGDDLEQWSLTAIEPARGFVAAVAARAPGVTVKNMGRLPLHGAAPGLAMSLASAVGPLSFPGAVTGVDSASASGACHD